MRNPVHSALFLLLTFLCVAVLFVLKAAEFVAAVQVLVYAGGIMVLFLFVVMLLNVPREEAPVTAAGLLGPAGFKLGAGLSVLLAVEVIWGLSRLGIAGFAQDAEATSVSSVARIGSELFTQHAFAFEATSILILVAMVGAVVLARREH
jgi:NADH-quinone oxidoreductase subunit J